MNRTAALLALVLSTTLLPSTDADAKRLMQAPPAVVSERLDARALPPGIKPKGKRLIAAWRFTGPDAKVGHLVLSSTETTSKASIGPGRRLYAQLYRGTKQIRLVQDGMDGCNLETRVAFVPDSVSFEDVDGDKLVEVAFAYDVACDMDNETKTRKLLVLEGPAKYALRGESRGKDMATGAATGGGYKAEGFGAQGAISAWAEARWDTLLATAPVTVDP